MISRLIRGSAAMLVYFGLATFLAEAILAAYGVVTQRIDREKLWKVVAILQGADTQPVVASDKQRDKNLSEQVSYEQIIEARAAKSHDLQLREQALRNAVEQLRVEQRRIIDQRKQYEKVRGSFEIELRTMQEGAVANGKEEVRSILESLKPKQAKQQLLEMLQKDEMDQVVALLAAMAPAKRAKIIGEFTAPNEAALLDEILRRLGQGAPNATLPDSTEKRLQEPPDNGAM